MLGSGYTVKTQESHLQRVEMFFGWCEDQGLLGRTVNNPAKKLREELVKASPKRRARATPRRDLFMPGELRQLTSAIQVDEASLDEDKSYQTLLVSSGRQWSRACVMQMLEVAGSIGLWVGELSALHFEHVELSLIGGKPVAAQVRVVNYDDHETRTGVERVVPPTPRAALILRSLLSDRASEARGQPVFQSSKMKSRLIARTVS